MIQVQNEANGLVNEVHRKIARMEALKKVRCIELNRVEIVWTRS